MKPIPALFLLIVSSCVTVASGHLCPVCKQVVVAVATQKDDLSKPSKNLAVWSRSHSGNILIGDGIYICMKDGYAFETSSKEWWIILTNRDGFAHPLAASIRSFPLPANTEYPSNPLYSQRFESLKSVTDKLQFWCLNDPEYFKMIKVYAKENGLSVTIKDKERNGRHKGKSIVRIEKKTEQDGADQPATAPESKAAGKEKTEPESEVRPQ